jgi:hypothetical protein
VIDAWLGSAAPETESDRDLISEYLRARAIAGDIGGLADMIEQAVRPPRVEAAADVELDGPRRFDP